MESKPLIYKDIKNNMYFINEYGEIYSNHVNRKLKPSYDKDGYLRISLSCNDGKRREFRLATLVLVTFIGLPPKHMIDPTVNHIDSNILNNHYSNLEWMERGKNSSIRIKKGTGIENHEAILTDKEVIQICNLLLYTELSYTDIGKKFNVSKHTISNIKNGKNWTSITKNFPQLKNCRLKVGFSEYINPLLHLGSTGTN